MFKPIAEVNIIDDLQLKLFEKDTAIAELEMLMQFKDDKIKKLRAKKDTLEEDRKELKNEVCKLRLEVLKLTTNQKNMLMTLIVVVIVVLIALK